MCSISHVSMILFLFWSSFVPFLLTVCVSKKSQKSTREASSERSKRSRVASSASVLPSDKSERALSSEKSVRRERNTTIDSLKVPRHPRPSNSGKDLKQVSSRGGLGSETDSQKTELIDVPLGKAARDDPSNNILTPLSELKASSVSFQNQKVSFAHSLRRVKRRGTKPEDPDEKTAYIP